MFRLIFLLLVFSVQIANATTCTGVTGVTCRLQSMADYWGFAGLNYGCPTDQECQFGTCVCKIGTCWDQATKTCVAWKKPNYNTRRGSARILCPVLAAMYNSGDLVPDQHGRVTQDQLQFALENFAGVHPWFARFQAGGVAAYHASDLDQEHRDRCSPFTVCGLRKLFLGETLEQDVRYLNIFRLGENRDVLHGFSTGVRGGRVPDPDNECRGTFPCEKRFQDFWVKYAVNGRLYREQIAEVICNAKVNGAARGEWTNSTTRFGREWQMKLAVNGFLDGFGRRDNDNRVYFTVEDLRSLIMHGRIPRSWVRRNWGSRYAAWSAVRTPLPCPDNQPTLAQQFVAEFNDLWNEAYRKLGLITYKKRSYRQYRKRRNHSRKY